MSWQQTKLVWDYEFEGSEQRLMLALADYADSSGGVSFPRKIDWLGKLDCLCAKFSALLKHLPSGKSCESYERPRTNVP